MHSPNLKQLGSTTVFRGDPLSRDQSTFTHPSLVLFVRLDGPLEVAPGAVPTQMHERTLDGLSDPDMAGGIGAAVRTSLRDTERESVLRHSVIVGNC